MCDKFGHVPKARTLSPHSAGFSRNPQKRQTEFEDRLLGELSEERPLMCLVESVADLPDVARCAVTNIISLPALSRQMVLKLYSVIHGRQNLTELRDMLRLLPSDEELVKLSPQELAIAIRKSKSQDMAAALAERVTQKKSQARVGALAEVRGLGNSRVLLEQLAEDLRSWKSGALPWDEIPRGLLFYGPPGTGKTFTAGKLAEEIGAHFVATSYSDWQKAGHLGDFLAAMNESFKEARAQAPAILFIDEIDSFGDRATASGDNSGYIRNAINGLLEQLDGAKTCEGVFVVAACNDFEALDAALIRSGRFDMKLNMPLPDKFALAEMLHLHIGEEVPIRQLDHVAAHLVGRSGADVAAVARQARSLARRHRRNLMDTDLWSAAQMLVPAASDADLHRAALHEAGHAVAGFLSGKGVPVSAEIGAQGGKVQFRPSSLLPKKRELDAELVCLLAGRAAEQVFLGAPSAGAGGGAQSDLAQATLLAARLDMQLGLGGSGLVWRQVTDETLASLLENHVLEDRVSRRLDTAADAAVQLISEHRDLVQSVADQLLPQRQLTRDELSELLSASSGETPAPGC
ncbi:AAA family ATPase [Ruegeria sp. HKCCA4707]|uniref:AAA family ATPase n=2 Tax=unclassified Ruegeria TaxID=2625375 RepID=UPI00352FF454